MTNITVTTETMEEYAMEFKEIKYNDQRHLEKARSSRETK